MQKQHHVIGATGSTLNRNILNMNDSGDQWDKKDRTDPSMNPWQKEGGGNKSR